MSLKIPYTATNALMESSVKYGSEKEKDENRSTQINIIFYLFWLELSMLIGTILLFFADVIPGFGTSRNICIFWEK